MDAEKVEFDEGYLTRVRQFFENTDNCKAALISRSSGSGENSHAFIRKRAGQLFIKEETYGKEQPVAEFDLLQPTLLEWEQRMRSRWAGSSMKVFSMEETPRNRNGKLPYYIKLTH